MKEDFPKFEDIKDRNPCLNSPKVMKDIDNRAADISQKMSGLMYEGTSDNESREEAKIRSEMAIKALEEFLEEYIQCLDFSKLDFTEEQMLEKLQEAKQDIYEDKFEKNSRHDYVNTHSAFESVNKLFNMYQKALLESGLDPLMWVAEHRNDNLKPERHSDMVDEGHGE